MLGKSKNYGEEKWEKNVSLISLIYKLITWIPEMQRDIECLVYLESMPVQLIKQLYLVLSNQK